MDTVILLQAVILLASCYLCQSVCEDKRSDCVEFGRSACHPPYDTWARGNCAQYCGFCNSTLVVPTTRMPTPTKGSCQDAIPDCVEYTKASCVGVYIPWAKQACPRFCGFCSTSSSSSSSGGCVYNGQHYSLGQNWKDGCSYNCTCLRDGFYRCTDLCPSFLNLPPQCKYVAKAGQCCKDLTCTNTTGSQNYTTSVNNACIYKGQSYKTGQVWQDGCTYNCTCLNETTGHYQCSDLCPTYVHISPFCSLVKETGSCCPKLQCNVNENHNFTGFTNQTIPLGGDRSCYFNGHNYNQGDEWYDGCAYKCTCQDGRNGYYTCQSRCVTWNLPSACHLEDPAPGKCCKTPKCPNGYSINYPPDYTQE